MTHVDMQYVEERMDQGDFIVTILWAAVKATLGMVALFLLGFFIIPSILQYVSISLWASLFVTVPVMLWIFRADLKIPLMKLVASLAAILYTLVMYVGGEVVFIGLVLMGIVLVILFIEGDAILTAWFTYLDLRKWVEGVKRAESYRQEQEAAKAAKAKGEA